MYCTCAKHVSIHMSFNFSLFTSVLLIPRNVFDPSIFTTLFYVFRDSIPSIVTAVSAVSSIKYHHLNFTILPVFLGTYEVKTPTSHLTQSPLPETTPYPLPYHPPPPQKTFQIYEQIKKIQFFSNVIHFRPYFGLLGLLGASQI